MTENYIDREKFLELLEADAVNDFEVGCWMFTTRPLCATREEIDVSVFSLRAYVRNSIVTLTIEYDFCSLPEYKIVAQNEFQKFVDEKLFVRKPNLGIGERKYMKWVTEAPLHNVPFVFEETKYDSVFDMLYWYVSDKDGTIKIDEYYTQEPGSDSEILSVDIFSPYLNNVKLPKIPE
jgi:hypothetical protein